MSTSSAITNRSPANQNHAISERVYGWLLKAYPVEFRREYGPQMLQFFRDCCREEKRSGSYGRTRFLICSKPLPKSTSKRSERRTLL